ncbi:helix-turn-helix transcriptional regulator [Mycolicibacterium goodii]|uniref:helix-turn-helix transcriptional regulator n=1 Tax=Mycolicibacterium goodii TaxID=134601 RepID=UPI000C25C38C|nr:helix-turn-helix transcriptional regulator [Mycolicibacterium goodii]MBU8833408.1 helix-turn-helix transcriptional regulator [Mycolicibacterium goodii]PJK23609.1 LuxR family transcriptional regulator [Mycolicibacterium goodii]
MFTVEDFSRLIAGIYAAAVTPQHWESALRDIRRTLGGDGGALLRARDSIWTIQNAILPPGAAASYHQYYCRLDRPLAAVATGPRDVVRTGAELIAPYRNSEFYVDWLHPHSIEDALFVRLTDGSRPSCIVVHTSVTSESFASPERVKALGALVPHLQQALCTQRALSHAAHGESDLAAALDTIEHGIAVLDSHGRVRDLNAAGQRILRGDDGLRMTARHITPSAPGAGAALARALHRALESDVPAGDSFTVERPSGATPFIVHVVPLQVHDGHRHALLVLVDPAHEPEPSIALVQRLYHLTRTEAEVALRVAQGAEPKHIADDLSVSITTVRTHLHRVFHKTGTHRQAELLRLLLSVRAIPVPDGPPANAPPAG